MMSVISRLRDREREGFTLIELLVVVLIIGILAAIAIPTFLGQRRRAQDRSAQSDLRNTLLAAKTIYTDGESYKGATADALRAIEPTITFGDFNDADGDGPGTDPVTVKGAEVGTVYVAGDVDVDGQVFVAAAKSESGAIFAIRDTAKGDENEAGTKYGTLTAASVEAANDGAALLATLTTLPNLTDDGTGDGWKSSW